MKCFSKVSPRLSASSNHFSVLDFLSGAVTNNSNLQIKIQKRMKNKLNRIYIDMHQVVRCKAEFKVFSKLELLTSQLICYPSLCYHLRRYFHIETINKIIMVHPRIWNFQRKQTTCSNDIQDGIHSQVYWQSLILQS